MTYYYTNCRTQVGTEVDDMEEILLIKEASKTMRQAFERQQRRLERNKTLRDDGFLFWRGKKLLGLYMLGKNKWKKAKFKELNSKALSGFHRTVFPFDNTENADKWANSFK